MTLDTKAEMGRLGGRVCGRYDRTYLHESRRTLSLELGYIVYEGVMSNDTYAAGSLMVLMTCPEF